MPYFYVVNGYSPGDGPKGRSISGHVIKCEGGKKEAIEFCKRHGIANPMGNPNIIFRDVRVLDERNGLFDMELIQQRRQGIGGNIFTENEDGELGYETSEHLK